MAAELEEALHESSELVQSSGGVFEIEDNDLLIFSKKALNRFPEDGEVLQILQQVRNGVPLAEAQKQANDASRQPPSFVTWFQSFRAKDS